MNTVYPIRTDVPLFKIVIVVDPPVMVVTLSSVINVKRKVSLDSGRLSSVMLTEISEVFSPGLIRRT